ncbi:MAG: hypothetical protein Q4C58_08330 [Eubacteriales bacterium]|nr:hypothetical protein [Eubacteriales bacterium]
MTEQLKVMREYKDTVFRMLYKDKKELLQLYNALNGTSYHDPEDLEVYTLESAIFMNVKNDVSFLLDSTLNLYEQQSSFNPNMPLRDLIYVARQLEKYFRNESIYSSRLMKISVPRFVVFYSGTKEQPENRVLKLSDAFQKEVTEPELELKVLMLNINLGHNKELLERCRTLKEYCIYVDRIRKYTKEMQIEEAVKRTVNECIQEGILADFLLSQKAEVMAMSIFEYNEEFELKKIREDEFNLGREAGIEEGIEKGISALIKVCKEFGLPRAEIMAKVEEKFSLSPQKAKEYMDRFWE